MPLPTTFAGDSARAQGLFSSVISISQNYWSALLNIANLSSVGRGITFDSSGNIYVCGYFQPASAQQIAFVSKYNSSGVLQWQKSLADLQTQPGDSAGGITIDNSGNVYVSGYAKIDSSNNTGSLVYKLNNNGDIQWQYFMNDAAYVTPSNANYKITIDSSNNVYVVGAALNGSINVSCIVYKLNSSGTLQWQKKLTDTYSGKINYAGFYNVTIDGSGNLYAVGRTTDPNTGYIIGIIAKYNSSGVLQWQRVVTDSTNAGGETLNGVAVDGSGNVYVVGQGASSGNILTLIIKYNSSGTLQWQRTLQNDVGGTTQTGDCVAIDSSNYIYVIGNGAYSGTKTGMSISKWDSSGTIQWQRIFASTNTSPASVGNFITVDNLGNLYFGGYLTNTSNIVCISISKLPVDGSKTGTYIGSTFKFTYYASSWFVNNSSFVSSISSTTDATSTMTNSSSSFTAATPTGTTETITF
jgi:hypothetical protein